MLGQLLKPRVYIGSGSVRWESVPPLARSFSLNKKCRGEYTEYDESVCRNAANEELAS